MSISVLCNYISNNMKVLPIKAAENCQPADFSRFISPEREKKENNSFCFEPISAQCFYMKRDTGLKWVK